MKKVIYIAAFLLSAGAYAQTGTTTTVQDTPANVNKKGDTVTTNTQLKKETDLQTMDAVKTKDHLKTTPEPKIVSEQKATKKKKIKRKSVTTDQ